MIGLNSLSGSAPHDRLSPRELFVLRQLSAGKSSVAIAKDCGLTVKAISTCRMRILETLQLPHTAALLVYAVKHGLLGAP